MPRACQNHTDALLWLVNHNVALPMLPGVATELLAINQESIETISVSQVARTIEKDPGLAARVLRVANSPYFGLARQVTNVQQALALIGLDEALSIVHFYLLTHAFPQDPARDESRLLRQWLHNWACATVAQALGQPRFLVQANPRDLYLAGLMHDIGRVLLAVCEPKMLDACFGLATAEGIPLRDAERRILGIDHSVLGGHLIEDWNLPPSLQEAAAYHHWPEEASEENLEIVGVVQLADIVAHRSQIGGNGAPCVEEASSTWLYRERLGAHAYKRLWEEAGKHIQEVLQKRIGLLGATADLDPELDPEATDGSGEIAADETRWTSRRAASPPTPRRPSRWLRIVQGARSLF